ncbi:hypothetical protein OIU78_014154 [Salix suchowensis]|nr:hypothetical protein OIU78_014154 [Salix suchowensis]
MKGSCNIFLWRRIKTEFGRQEKTPFANFFQTGTLKLLLSSCKESIYGLVHLEVSCPYNKDAKTREIHPFPARHAQLRCCPLLGLTFRLGCMNLNASVIVLCSDWPPNIYFCARLNFIEIF